MSAIASPSLSFGVTKWVAGKTLSSLRSASSSPVSGSSSVIRSTSSPKNSTRTMISDAGRADLQRVAADPEPGAGQGGVVALVLEVDQVPEHAVAPVLAADLEPQDRRAVVDRRAETVDARHRRDDDHVAPLEQRVGRGVAQPVDLLVPARVLLDVRVRPRQVRLGLVVVEVADEVLDGVVREELAELGVQLGGQRLVVRQDQRRASGAGRWSRPSRTSCRCRSRPAASGGAGRLREAARRGVRWPAAGRRWARRGRRVGSRARPVDRTTPSVKSNVCSIVRASGTSGPGPTGSRPRVWTGGTVCRGTQGVSHGPVAVRLTRPAPLEPISRSGRGSSRTPVNPAAREVSRWSWSTRTRPRRVAGSCSWVSCSRSSRVRRRSSCSTTPSSR